MGVGDEAQRSVEEAFRMALFLFYFTLFYFWSFVLFRAAPMAYGGSQARGLIVATAAILYHSHSNATTKLYL